VPGVRRAERHKTNQNQEGCSPGCKWLVICRRNVVERAAREIRKLRSERDVQIWRGLQAAGLGARRVL